MRILVLNWRDLASSGGGGAERVTHEIARRLCERGHQVTWLSSSERRLAEEEDRDGFTIVRRGGQLTTHLYGPLIVRRGFDVVVDAINTVPYLAPVWSPVPVVAFFHQLARDVWWYEAPLPLAAIGWATEPLYLQVYRRTPVVTVSTSTRDDLRRLGLRARIDVIPLAAAAGAEPSPQRSPSGGRLVAIGRLTRSKRFEDAIAALAELRRTHADARLDVVGTGPDLGRLEREAAALGVAEHVTFHGRVDDRVRDGLLANADALVGTSVREGWGLTVTEAALAATPAVVYDIPGFRDSVVNGRTGFVTAARPAALADGIRALIDHPSVYDRIVRAAHEHASGRTWEATASAFESALVAAVARRGRPHRPKSAYGSSSTGDR
jgi:glycosyltransferase involved in cell wall biosynthesis